MIHPTKFLIDGIDRLGKSTLINNILNRLGYHLVIHYDKPKHLLYYSQMGRYRDCDPDNYALRRYQEQCNIAMFHLLETEAPIIFDRTHLGETVYAPLYRDYDGSYVFTLEDNFDTSTSRLILLTTSNFDICEDDGESFDFSKKELEQQLFIDAFYESGIKDKIMIDVYDPTTGTFRPESDIVAEALRSVKGRK